jgi:hypothetical protein
VESFQNVATGNATVGFQVGKNTGTLNAGPSAVDRLKTALDQAELSGEERAEAEHEIATARYELINGDKGRATRALKRLAGMTEGIAGFGALVGAVIQGIGS